MAEQQKHRITNKNRFKDRHNQLQHNDRHRNRKTPKETKTKELRTKKQIQKEIDEHKPKNVKQKDRYTNRNRDN